ncbi:MAG: hypothetical protein IIC50_14115, partial [Planctomycetes bacterium]|nr:hypothetical protein [Planctomycetota bacterium]
MAIRDKYEDRVLNALKRLKECSAINDDGSVSYSGKDYPLSMVIIESMVPIAEMCESLERRCLKNAVNRMMQEDAISVQKFSKMVGDEVRRINSDKTKYYEVVSSFFVSGILRLRPRRWNGVLLRTGTIVNVNGTYKSFTLGRRLIGAIRGRHCIRDAIKDKDWLPLYREGSLYLASRVSAVGPYQAREQAEMMTKRYISLLNLVIGYGKGRTWDVNPLQPQGSILPSPYTTVHDCNGNLIEGSIYYDGNASSIRPSGKSISRSVANELDDLTDVVLRRIKAHFDPEMIWHAIELYGESMMEIDSSAEYLKAWMALERLMCFGPGETHEAMMKRLRFIVPRGSETMYMDLFESMRITRNRIAHQGKAISALPALRGGAITVLSDLIKSLVYWHLRLPKSIKTRDDLVKFTKLPYDRAALLKTRALAVERL